MKTLIVLSLSVLLSLSPLGCLADGAEKQAPVAQQNVQKRGTLQVIIPMRYAAPTAA